MIKYIIYILHLFFIFYSTIGIFYYWQSLLLLFLTQLSWYLNDNKCLLTQIEYFLFNESLIDYYYKYIIKNERIISKFTVPKYQRDTVKIIFIFGILYNLYY